MHFRKISAVRECVFRAFSDAKTDLPIPTFFATSYPYCIPTANARTVFGARLIGVRSASPALSSLATKRSVRQCIFPPLGPVCCWSYALSPKNDRILLLRVSCIEVRSWFHLERDAVFDEGLFRQTRTSVEVSMRDRADFVSWLLDLRVRLLMGSFVI